MVPSPPNSQAGNKPPSATFHSPPNDLELLNTYLRPWVDSGVKAGDFIHVSDVYAAGPATLAAQFEPAVAPNGDPVWYFFTQVRRKAERGRGSRMARTVATGEGWYHNESRPKPVISVLDGGRVVGYKQTFTFMSKDDAGGRVRTGWLMMELHLGTVEGPVVLCKVYRSPRHQPTAAAVRARRKREADGEDDESCVSPRTKGKSEDGDSDGTAGRRKSDGEGSSAATVAAAAEHWHEIPVTASVAAPGRKGKEADDEGSAETSATPSENKKKEASDDEGSVAAPAAEPPRGKNKIDDDTQQGPHCPHCGGHLDLEELLAAARSKQETKPETEIVQVEGDASVIEHKFHRFF